MKEENKGMIFILLVFIATVMAMCGGYGIAHSLIGGMNSIILSIPFWIIAVVFYLIAYLFATYGHKKVVVR